MNSIIPSQVSCVRNLAHLEPKLVLIVDEELWITEEHSVANAMHTITITIVRDPYGALSSQYTGLSAQYSHRRPGQARDLCMRNLENQINQIKSQQPGVKSF